MTDSFNEQIWSRPVNLGDSKEILLWRNDRVSRENFKNQHIVSQKEHQVWLEKKLNSSSSSLIMFGRDEIKIGIVRLDIEQEYIDVSINLNPNERGKKLGKKMLKASERYLNKSLKEKKLRAEILKMNILSQKVFERAGYKLESTKSNILIYIKEL
jgi:RimJ/RimL family protein N-acetyltransferase